MRHFSTSIAAALVAGSVAIAGEADEQGEHKIELRDLPPVVKKAAEALVRDATVKEVSMETKDKKTTYELSLELRGRHRDVTLDGSGKVVSVESEVKLDEVPEPARAALKKGIGDGTLEMVESVTEGDKPAFYEAHAKRGGKEYEIKVAPDGKAIIEPAPPNPKK